MGVLANHWPADGGSCMHPYFHVLKLASGMGGQHPLEEHTKKTIQGALSSGIVMERSIRRAERASGWTLGTAPRRSERGMSRCQLRQVHHR